METIIFDLDDTLYDQLEPFKKAFEMSFPHLLGVPVEKLYVSSRKHSDAMFDKSEAGMISLEELHCYRITAAFQEFEITISRAEALKFQEIYQKEQQKIALFSDIKVLLDKLQGQAQLAVLTNGPYEHQLMKMNQLGLTRWIPKENFFISEAIGAAKPNLQAFLFIEKKLKLSKRNTVYIGDSFQNDTVGAKQAGWKAIWLNHRRKTAPISAVRPDHTVCSPAELFQLFYPNNVQNGSENPG